MAPPASILPVHHNQLTSGHDSGKPILVALVAGVATFVATITVASLFSQTPAGSLWSAPASVPAAHATRITTSTITSRPPSMHATASFQPSAHNNVEPPTTLLGYEGGAQSQLPQERPGTIRLLMPFVALFGAVATAVALFLSPRRSHEEEYAMLAMAGKKRGPSPLRAEKWDPSKGTNLGGLFGSSKTPTMGGSTTAAKKEEEKYYQDIEISSERGVDYTLLKQLLKDGEWEEADNEHRRLLIELAGPAAVAREYVWPTEVADIPEQDMKMLDTLWANYSGGKFGFSVQRKIWVSGRGNWTPFFQKLNWVTGENNDYRSWAGKGFIYSLDVEKGHLPLTNALRGTSLLQAVLEHPAFGGEYKNKQVRK